MDAACGRTDGLPLSGMLRPARPASRNAPVCVALLSLRSGLALEVGYRGISCGVTWPVTRR